MREGYCAVSCSCVYLSVHLLPLQLLQRAFKNDSRVFLLGFSCVFAHNGGLQLPEAQLVGRMLLQRLPTGATGVKQAR